jgi:transcriptional regulator with GAF, ATPase, and Fis domain
VDRAAAELCASAHLAVFRQDSRHDWVATSSELRLERVCARIGEVRSRGDLRGLLDPICALLHADDVALSLLGPSGDTLVTMMAGREEGEEEDPYPLDDYPATARILESGAALQVLASDTFADPAERALLHELGYGAVLMVPLQSGARSVGVLEYYTAAEGPWSRAQIHRARILAYQLGRVLAGLTGSDPSLAGLVLDPERVVEQQAAG